ncbi:MAG: hypothetical protein ACUVRD_09370 [Bacteroidia bacterium]
MKLAKYFLACLLWAQTDLIPLTQGSFEVGTSGWTLVNGTQTNRWCIGAAAGATDGSRAIYISDAGTCNSHNYNTGSTSVVHFYRDVFIPAGTQSLTLSFDLKLQGENNFDYLDVYLTPTTFTPTAGALVTTGTAIVSKLSMVSSTWVSQSYSVCPALAGTTRRLIFTWRNDASGGTPPPAALDRIRLIANPVSPIMGSYGDVSCTNVSQTTVSTSGNINADDIYSGVIPIGFNFCFLGTTHNQVVISSNGIISFNTGYANAYSSYVTVPYPTTDASKNVFFSVGIWHDIVPPSDGYAANCPNTPREIVYGTTGTAPNRVFTVWFRNNGHFGGSCSGYCSDFQIKLYETSNVIEVHTFRKDACTGWNSGNAVMGIHGGSGVGWAVCGRNNTVWTAANEVRVWWPATTCNNFGFSLPVGTSCSPLALVLSSFKGEAVGGRRVLLTWELTQSPDPGEEFEIERWDDGTWIGIGRVKGQGMQYIYHFVDEQAPVGPVEYRLRLLEKGQTRYSPTIRIEVPYTGEVSFYPIGPRLYQVSFPYGEVRYEVYTVEGRVVRSGGLQGENTLSLEGLPSGFYVVGLYQGGDKVGVFKVVL